VPTESGLFRPAQVVVRRNYRGPHVSWAQATTVVSDDEQGLALWLPVGADFEFRLSRDGTMLRTGTVEEFGAAPLIRRRWRENSLLMWHPPGRAHSVWWFFREGRFRYWYINLESPYIRGADCIANVDHHLDVVVYPDLSWQWKDEEDLDEVTGMPGFWTAQEAALIRDEGRRVVAVAETGGFPFDGTWCDFRPDPHWQIPRMPAAPPVPGNWS
jgi:hypothetical protein